MERDCESELSKLNIEQNACIYHFGASVIHGQRSNILRLLQIILNLDDPHRKILTHEQSTRLKGADFHDTDTLSHEQPFDSKRKIIRRIALP